MVRKGCEAYLTNVIDTKKEDFSLSNVLIVCDYPDVFLEELPGLPPRRGTEFAIEVVRVPFWHPLNRVEWLW